MSVMKVSLSGPSYKQHSGMSYQHWSQ